MDTQEAKVNRIVLQRVIRLRESLGLEKQVFAAALSLSPAGYTPYEQGQRPFSIAQIFTLAKATGTPVAWLLGLDLDMAEDEQEALFLYRLIAEKEMALRYLRMMAHVPERQSPG
jgi:transcriptional regulator with XRE-family HTH domain